ncbi:hypothetical protein DFQ01_11013 [Paenibacillus cellulosilyticus]|uniref:Uncharacterized protein n=1 Tax=Paenibacillus cellulosilyticus TaxID=375489 RepID=A0A2V2YW08_9BACL|nr:hypothetical protein [Paenibacillus cellulosilyticus]PWW01124.1 hypothetical protein DFQ01_11013 [Paenibacillus cellulosilyticus]QKS46908.1 hypothetical protein HUB94_20755 [Paenibacillus cellulosilyticus]
MDGVQPEKGDETLYVVREVFSGTILVAKSVKSSWNEYIVRSGEFVVFVDDALRQQNLLKRLQDGSYDTFRKERERWSKRLEEPTKRSRFRRDHRNTFMKNNRGIVR